MLDVPVGNANCIFGYGSPVGGKQASWAIGIDLSGALSNAIFEEVFTAVSGTDIGPALHTGWSLTSFVMEDNVSRFEVDFSSPGTAGGNSASPQVAALFKKVTGVRGKKFGGRAYLPAGYLDDEEVNNAGDIDTDIVGTLNLLIQGMLGDMVGAGGGSGAMLFHTHPDDAPTPIVDFFCESKVATQRRRLR